MPSSAKYILGRLAFSLVTLLVIAIATFSLMHSIPGGPFSRERALPKEIEAHLARKYNLDESTARQFQRYMTGLVKGDLGLSLYHEGRTTNTIIAETFPKSAAIGFTGFVIAFALGVPVGIFAAMRRDRLTDHALMLAAILGVSVPGFIVASLLQYWLAFKFGWAPAAGWGESWWQVLLPALALAAFPLAFVSRLVRTSMLNVLNADYLRTARSKGLHNLMVVGRHGFRNAMLPVVTYAAPLLASLLTGSFVVETIFAIPGLGSYFVTSITDRDYTVIMGVTLFYSALLIAFNLLSDVVMLFLDPRLRAEE